MSVPRLSSIDLNLLVALGALLREESVTRAGKRLGLSQPAVSQALSKLRDWFNDPLLVREGGRMRRTALATALLPRVRALLDEAEATLTEHLHFDPKTSQRTFRVVANDFCTAVLLPSVVQAVRAKAPNVTLEVHAEQRAVPAERLARGELDLVVGTFEEVPPQHRNDVLFEEGFSCLARRGHPSIGRKLSLDAFVALDHLLVASPGYGAGVVDIALSERRLARRVVVRVPHFLAAPALVAHSDMVITLPSRLARLCARTYDLRLYAPPLALPSFSVRLLWHERTESSPASLWLRRLVKAAAR